MNFNWEAIGAVGELVGALGVVVTLGYLAVQIRHNSRNIWSQNVHARTQQTQQSIALQINPQLVVAIEKAYISRTALEHSDMILLEAYLVSYIATLEDDFLHYNKGLLSESEWERSKVGILSYFDAPFAQKWLTRAMQDWEPSLYLEITNMLEQQDTSYYAGSILKRKSDDHNAA